MNAKIIIALLLAALLASLAWSGYECWQNYFWKQSVRGLACYWGSARAERDFHEGKVRLFIIAGEHQSDIYSGTNDGLFQIWFPQYYSSPDSLRESAECMAAMYNSNMKSLCSHPAQTNAATNP